MSYFHQTPSEKYIHIFFFIQKKKKKRVELRTKYLWYIEMECEKTNYAQQ